MTFNIAVVDDNSADAEYVSCLVRRWGESEGHFPAVSEFSSAESFLFRWDDERYDIILLDIEMGAERMNGVDFAKELRCRDDMVQIVFITGIPDFVAEGYDVSALHYLMKPVSYEKLSAVLSKAASNLEKTEKLLPIIYDRQTEYVPISKILYVEAQKQYVLIHTEEKTYRKKSSLSDTACKLDEYFFKCQRSFLINLRYLSRVKNNCAVLKNGAEIPISRGMAEKIGKEIIRLF